MDKRIYTVIENKKRELDSKNFFALAMNERNYSVGFGKKQNLYQYSNYIKKGSIFNEKYWSKKLR